MVHYRPNDGLGRVAESPAEEDIYSPPLGTQNTTHVLKSLENVSKR